MARRANGEGTISKRLRDGKVIGWRTAITVGTDAQGRQVRRWISGKTQSEVQDALRRLQSELHQGLLSLEGELTVGELLDQWLGYKEREDVKPNTLRSYRDTARLYLKPHLGKTKLEKLRPLDVEHLLGRLRQDGKSAAQMAYTLRVLKMALKQAVLWQLVARNVADAVRPPRRHSPELQVWTAAQAAAFLQVSATHRLHAAFFLALMTGMRRGEILGLKWADIDWERRRLRVRHNLVEIRGEPVDGKMHAGQRTVSSVRAVLQTPKTSASRRNVALSPGTLQKLREHQQRQGLEMAALGPDWDAQDFVFANVFGGPTEPRALYGWYRQIVTEAGLPAIRFHDLRHTAASLMIQNGMSAKTVSDRLGHADVAFTLRVYTHLYDDQREEAAFDLAELFPLSAGGPNEAAGPGDSGRRSGE